MTSMVPRSPAPLLRSPTSLEPYTILKVCVCLEHFAFSPSVYERKEDRICENHVVTQAAEFPVYASQTDALSYCASVIHVLPLFPPRDSAV